jgi:hypothetical protein
MKIHSVLFACAVFLCNTGCSRAQDKPDGLKDYFRSCFPVGVAVAPSSVSGPQRELILQHFNSLTAENVMKPSPIHPEETVYSFQNADLIIIGIQSLLYVASSVLLALVVRGLILHVPDPRLGGWLLWLAVGCAAAGAPAAAVYLYGCQSVLVMRMVVAAGLTANVSWVVLLCLCYREFTRAEAISLRHCRPDE